jgi:hypothetical protein
MSPMFAKIIFWVLGLLAFGAGLKGFLQGRKSQYWPRANGEILESAVTGIDEDFVTVKYRYTVKGQEYRGDRFRFTGGSDGDAPEIVKQYQPGTPAEVIYDPDDPSFSALEHGPAAGPVIFMVAGLIFIAFSYFFSF